MLDPTTGGTNSQQPERAAAQPARSTLRLLLRDSPYLFMLLIAMLGIAYTSFTGKPILLYWGILGPVYGAICVAIGWRREPTPEARWHLVGTQILHWAAVVIAMFLIFVPNARGIVNNTGTGLNLLTLLALGTFLSGLHSHAWRVCVVGGVLALAVPAIAWIEQFALLMLVVVVVLIGVAVVFWLAREDRVGGTSASHKNTDRLP